MKPRLAARSVLVHHGKLLLVNAWANKSSRLWCAPGGGVNAGHSLPDNLSREVYEETGLRITVRQPCLVNEFHNPKNGFHQVEIFFRCELLHGELHDDWQDPEGVVSKRRWFSRMETQKINIKPSSLPILAWNSEFGYDPLEPIAY